MNSTRGRQSTGCWTCRLRHKKCSGIRPRCEPCQALGITCHFTFCKPGWWDGGAQQKEMAEKIKAEIKRSAQCRRERHSALAESGHPCGSHGHQFVLTVDACPVNLPVEPEPPQSLSSPPTIQASRPDPSGIEETFPEVGLGQSPNICASYSQASEAAGGLASTDTNSDRPSLIDAFLELTATDSGYSFLGEPQDCLATAFERRSRNEFEVHFLAKYLDHVFPFLFPFYRPGLLDTGRSWLLALLHQSKVAYHSAVSLTAYFFSVAISESHPGQHTWCKYSIWTRLMKQSDISFEMIQQEIQELRSRREDASTAEKTLLMGSIIQIILFELVVGRSATWSIHLTAALAIFEDIFQAIPTSGTSEPKMLHILDTMVQHARYSIGHGLYLWSPSQNGFRFFAAILVVFDIIASTVLERPPHLLRLHSEILEDVDDGSPNMGLAKVQLSDIIGCQNWVLRAIAKTAALDAWKKSLKRTGRLSVMELATRAGEISADLKEGISRTSAPRPQRRNLNSPSSSLRMFLADSPHTSSATVTKIWAHAAQVYLTVVVSGWQPSNTEVRAGVRQALELLQTVESPSHLRSLAWPLCVVGCLAHDTGEEREFNQLYVGLCETEVIGSLGEARKIMQNVWQTRETISADTWDMASCFRVLGHPILLF